MKTTRRSFLSLAPAGAGSAASLHAISARGREAWEAENGFRGGPVFVPPPEDDEIRISSNENPLGPGPAAVAAIRDAYTSIMRYPMNAQVSGTDLRSKIGGMYGGKADNVVLSAGSGEILRTAVRTYTGPDRPLVTAECSYESPVRAARYFGAQVKALPLTGGLGLDPRQDGGSGDRRRARLPLQPEQPDRHRPFARRRDGLRELRQEGVPVHRHPARRGLLRLRLASRLRHRAPDSRWNTATCSWRGTFSKALRHGRTPDRLRLRTGEHHREARAATAHVRNLRPVHRRGDGLAGGPRTTSRKRSSGTKRPASSPMTSSRAMGSIRSPATRTSSS